MENRKKGILSIRDVLKERGELFYGRLLGLWGGAHGLQERQQSKEHHQQGSLHCLTVEKNLGQIISDEEKKNHYTSTELFLLSVAACYHDAGKSDDFKDNHASVVMKDIFFHPGKYNLSDPEGKVLSFIIGSHDLDEIFDDTPETYTIANEDIRVRILSALFRLADVLHTDYSRIPHIIVGDMKEDDDKTRFRRLVKGWGFEGAQIKLTTTPENFKDVDIIAKGASMMQDQIEGVAPILRLNGYPYEIQYSCDDRGMRWLAEKEDIRTNIEMDYYTEDDAEIFKGRNREIEQLFQKINGKKKISLLIGNSGIGKTSLIRAGLFPKLEKMGWNYIWTRVFNPNPVYRVLEDINADMNENFDDLFSSIKKLSEENKKTIIAVDQFEDIIRSPQPIQEQMGNILLHIYSGSFKNIRVLLAYRSDYEPEINDFLSNIGVEYPQRSSLLGLDALIASEVLRNIFEINNVGITDELLIRIVNELENESEHSRLYPPFIQIISNSLINMAKSNRSTITEELYQNQAVSVNNTIGNYLLNRLNEFGDNNSVKRKNAEQILKELVRDSAKEQKSKIELEHILNISGNEIQELLDQLVDKRLVRYLKNENYEIIHDYLALRIEDKIEDDERAIRSVRDILRTKAQHYQFMPIPSLLEPNEMTLLYTLRDSIRPTLKEKELLIFSYLARNGPALWWIMEDGDKVYRNIIIKALSSSILDVRQTALAAFEKLGTYDDLPNVKQMLNDTDSHVREAALAAFEKLGTHDDLPDVKQMLNDTDSHVREAALAAFEKLGTHDDLPDVKQMLNDTDSDVRKAAVTVFEKLGTYDDLPDVKQMLNDTDSDVREVALVVFEKLGTYDDMPDVKQMLNDTDYHVRKAAVMVFEKLVAHDDMPDVKQMLNDTNWDVRKAAVTAFEKLGTHDDLPDVKQMLNDTDRNVREAAVAAFEKLVAHDDLPYVKQMLNDTDSDVRTAAVTAFEKLGTHDDMPNVKQMLNDTDYQVREAALAAFEKLVTHDDLPDVKQMFKDTNWDVRLGVQAAFEKLVTHDDLPDVKQMLNDTDRNVREPALAAFEKLVTFDDLPYVKQMLNDIDYRVREVALTAFEKFVTHDDLPDVKQMLNDTDYHVREAALATFEKFVTHDDMPDVKRMLYNLNENIHHAAVAMCEKFGTNDDLSDVRQSLRATDQNIRKAAVSAYEKLGTHFDLYYVQELLNDTDSDVRKAAVAVYEKLGTHDDLYHVQELLNDTDSDVRKAAVAVYEKFANELDLMDISTMYTEGEIVNKELLDCIIKLDEKFYSQKL